MVVWALAPWKVGAAPWRQQEQPTYTTTRAWKTKAGNKGKYYQYPPKVQQQYHVCPSCPKWVYHDKLKQQGGLCLCGATIDHKLQHRSWNGWHTQGNEQQTKAMEVMAVVASTLDSSQLAALRIEYPDLLPSQGKAAKVQDSFQLAVKDSSQAFRTYKKAVELKGKLQLKVASIEQQLEDVRKELSDAVASFESAEKEQLAAVQALALEAKKEPEAATKEEDKGMELDGGGKKDEEPPAGAEEPAEAVEPEQFKLYRATLEDSAKAQLDAHLEYLGSSKKRKQETSEAQYQASMEQARSMAQGLQALQQGFDFAALAGKGKGGGGPAKAEGKGSARPGPY
jgi:hypothetical protein